MAKKTIADVDVQGKKVFMRCDFNVPLDKQGNITSDDRIVKALPSIRYVLDHGGALILASHLGRPEGKPDPAFSLRPVAKRLSDLLGKEVLFCEDCVGPKAKSMVAALKPGEVLLLENVRFHKEETIKDKVAKEDPQLRQLKDAFARQMAEMADVYVNDAFGTAHRDNASMYTVPQMMKGKPRVMGFLVERELQYLGQVLKATDRPFVAILGGAKVSDKIGVIENLLDRVDRILIGGAMAYTFLKALGKSIGKSLCEDDFVDKAQGLLDLAKDKGKEMVLPVDSVIAKEIRPNVGYKVVGQDIPAEWIGVDIGPKTRKLFADKLKDARMVVWNGPMGVFEIAPFDEGTKAVAQAVAAATERGAKTVVGGGDSESALKKLGLDNKISHISTGGGASLEFLEGKAFKGIEILDDRP